MKTKSLTTVLLVAAVIFFSLVDCSMAIAPLSKPFISGQGYPWYRTPAIVKANNGDLLAFCGGRQNRGDDSVCDIVLRRSSDGGKTWKSLQKIAGNGTDRFAIPVPVVLDNGKIILLYLKSDLDRTYRDAYVRTSTDDGKNWSSATKITSQITKSTWDHWIGIGPAHGIVKQQTPNKGRIIIGGRYMPKGGSGDDQRSYAIYSDDNGASWKIGGSIDKKSTEVAVVELTNGKIMLNARCNDDKGYRRVAVSTNGEGSPPAFGASYLDTNLPCPARAGSMLRYGDNILFSNPRDSSSETKGTVQRSADNGATWPWRQRYNSDGEFSSYSDIVRVSGDIGVLVEWGKDLSHPHQEIRFIIVPKADLGL